MTVCGIATIPEREDSFRDIIKAISPQVDKVVAVLNGYEQFSPWMHRADNVEFCITNKNVGDAGKFWGLGYADQYYFALDDDLIVPNGYVKYMIKGVQKYNGVVSLHGRVYNPPVKRFKHCRVAYRCLNTVVNDVVVNFIGSGCCAFDVNRLKIKVDDFTEMNMADVFLSKLATEQNIPMIVLAHRVGYIRYIKPTSTIWSTTHDTTTHERIINTFIK